MCVPNYQSQGVQACVCPCWAQSEVLQSHETANIIGGCFKKEQKRRNIL